MSRSDWESLTAQWGLPRFRAAQIFDALHRRGVRDYAAVRELPGELRDRLGQELAIRLPEIARREPSADGSVKLGLRLADAALVEAVFMPGERGTAQVNEYADARVST